MFKKIFYISIILVNMLSATTVDTDKETYTTNESIVVDFSEMEAQNSDWIAIYPSNANNDWGNQVQWKWTDDIAAGVLNFDALAVGVYEVRVFYNNSYVVEASKQFTVTNDMVDDAAISTNKATYTSNEDIIVSFAGLTGLNGDWIGIYPSGTTNAWGNQVQWKWTDDIEAGVLNFDSLAVGTYDVRVFYNNSYILEASTEITIEDNNPVATTVATTKDTYLPDEEIVAVFDNMSGNEGDWIGIYPVGSTNEWVNMLQWAWIEDGLLGGTETFDAMPVGNYEVRVFFDDSFNDESVYAFSVEAAALPDFAVSKEIYDPFELIKVEYNNFRGVEGDWIGIFTVNANHLKENALEWRSAKSLISGELSFNGLPAGIYQARSYFDNAHQETIQFTVQDIVAVRTLYDDFEDGIISPLWVRAAGPEMTMLNVGAIDGLVGHTERQATVNGQHSLRTYRDYRNGLNHSGYYFNFQNPDKKMKFLEVDMKIGVSSHVFAFGVKLKTKFGNRRIEFAAWLNHTLPSGQQIIRGPYGNVLEGHRQANTTDNYLHVHPGPTDYYVATSHVGAGQNMFVHYKINIEEKLRVLEPDNELLGITLFTTSGGDYDNLALTSH